MNKQGVGAKQRTKNGQFKRIWWKDPFARMMIGFCTLAFTFDAGLWVGIYIAGR